MVGAVGSEAWATSRYGAKIEKAMSRQQSGQPIAIVREYTVIDALLASERS